MGETVPDVVAAVRRRCLPFMKVVIGGHGDDGMCAAYVSLAMLRGESESNPHVGHDIVKKSSAESLRIVKIGVERDFLERNTEQEAG